MGSIFFSSGDSHTRGLLVLLHLSLEGITKVETDPKGGLCLLRLLHSLLMTEFSVFKPLSGHSTRENLASGWSFKGIQSYMENKNDRNENKTTPGGFNDSIDKMDRYDGNKTQMIYRLCSNYALIVDNYLRVYGEGITHFSLNSPVIIGPLARIHDRQGLN